MQTGAREGKAAMDAKLNGPGADNCPWDAAAFCRRDARYAPRVLNKIMCG
jgi:hypothetical protein